jgi:hypothetical protein
MPRRTLSKQSLQGQVSAKLTLEICINNASSNSRLTAAGRQDTAADTIHRPVSRLFFFLLFSLPLMREQPNYTCILKNLLKLYCTRTWDSLWGFFLFSVVLFYFVFSSIFTLWWDNHRTTSEAPSPGLEAEGRTPKLLRLKLYCIWTWRFFIFLFTYLFSFLFIYFLFFLFSILSLSV